MQKIFVITTECQGITVLAGVFNEDAVQARLSIIIHRHEQDHGDLQYLRHGENGDTGTRVIHYTKPGSTDPFLTITIIPGLMDHTIGETIAVKC